MTIDLTGSVPQLLLTCDCCARDEHLYQLIGTKDALCGDCFAAQHR